MNALRTLSTNHWETQQLSASQFPECKHPHYGGATYFNSARKNTMERSCCRGRLKARTAAAWKSCMNFQNKCRNVPWRLTADGPTGTVTPLITNGTFTLKRRLTTTRHTVVSETLFKLPVVTAIPPVQNLKFTWHMPSAPPVHSCSYSLR